VIGLPYQWTPVTPILIIFGTGTQVQWPCGTVLDLRPRSRWFESRPPLLCIYQRQLSVPSLRGRLMSTSESWGVNGHTTRCITPVSVVLRLRLVFGWGLWNSDQRRPIGPWGSGRTLLFTYFTVLQLDYRSLTDSSLSDFIYFVQVSYREKLLSLKIRIFSHKQLLVILINKLQQIT